MLAGIIRWSLRFPLVVCALAALLLAYGVFALLHAKYDVFPEFVPPQAVVQTEAPGLVAEQVELLVTLPIEQAISAASGVTAVRSESISGLSIVTVVFRDDMDPYRARQIVADALREATERLPDGVKAPKLEPLTSSTMDLAKIGFVSDTLSPMGLYDLLQWTVRPRLLAVPGVARATLYGGEQRELAVQVDPRALNARDLSFADVVAAVRAATGVRGGGFIETPNQRVLIETRGQALDAADPRRRRGADRGGQCAAAPARLRHRDRGAGTEVRRCDHHGPARRAVQPLEPVRSQHARGDARRRGGARVDAADAGGARRHRVSGACTGRRPSSRTRCAASGSTC